MNVKALVGSGDRIAVVVLPFVIVGLILNVAFPSLFDVGGPSELLRAVSIVVLVPGVAIWIWSALLILTNVPRGELITSGPYAVVKHPLYTAMALLVLPWVGFLLNTWLGLVIGLVLYVAGRRFEPEEEATLARTFGARLGGIPHQREAGVALIGSIDRRTHSRTITARVSSRRSVRRCRGWQMPDQPEPACLVVADISGYTSYLAGVELDHAQDILADLTDVVVRALRPTFRLAKLEGDAAFAYVVTDVVDGSVLQDTIEHCYIAFRRRLRDIGQASQCDCNACTYIPRLDLKFVVHHGLIARQRMAGREELVGRDVIVVHRLLKNDVQAASGIGAYALYTDDCVRIMGLTDPAAAGLIRHSESYEFVGEVSGWVRDLEAVWRDAESSASLVVEAADAAWSTSVTFEGPPAIAWEWITSPARRLQWQIGVDAVNEDTAGGRRGVGTTNHCVHGRDAIVEEILAWHPPEVLTTRFQMPMPGVPKLTRSELFEATPDGDKTLFTVRVQRPSSAKDRAKLEEMASFLFHAYGDGLAMLAPLIEADVAARSAAATAVPEPELPVSAGRNLTARA